MVQSQKTRLQQHTRICMEKETRRHALRSLFIPAGRLDEDFDVYSLARLPS